MRNDQLYHTEWEMWGGVAAWSNRRAHEDGAVFAAVVDCRDPAAEYDCWVRRPATKESLRETVFLARRTVRRRIVGRRCGLAAVARPETRWLQPGQEHTSEVVRV